jgi:DNA-binding NarL/FixJ family response regulator
MLTVSENEHDVAAALQAGANGYVLKGSSGSELLQVVKTIWEGQSYVTPTLAARLLTQTKKPVIETGWQSDVASLKYREKQVLQLLSQGLMNKEIAHRLKLTEKTVKCYMTVVMQKLKVRNRLEAVLISGHRMAEIDGIIPASNRN